MVAYLRSRAPVLSWLALLLFLLADLAAPQPASAAGAAPPPARPAVSGEEQGEALLTYVVRPGDNLSLIARRYNTRVAALQRANHMGEATLILIGQRLVIPVLPAEQGLAQAPNARRGLAMAVVHPEDLTSLGVGWFYTWNWCAGEGCVPMVYRMELPPICAPIILVGNEPNAVAPSGWPVTPTLAAVRVRAIELSCPQAQLVVGNVAADDWSSVGGTGTGRDWLLGFLSAYQRVARHDFHQTLGVHCYSQALASYCLDQLAELRAVYAGPMWVTEFGLLSGGPREFDRVLQYAAGHFERFAAYTNRQPHTGQGWELNTGVEMVRPNGSLTAVGDAYAIWPRAFSSQMR